MDFYFKLKKNQSLFFFLKREGGIQKEQGEFPFLLNNPPSPISACISMVLCMYMDTHIYRKEFLK